MTLTTSTAVRIAGIAFMAVTSSAALNGCLLAAAGVGAEAGYVASQEDRNPSETLNDQRISSSVKTLLLSDPKVSGLDINVDVHKSVVTLRGFIDSSEEADAAISLAQSVSGVSEVKSQLVFKQ